MHHATLFPLLHLAIAAADPGAPLTLSTARAAAQAHWPALRASQLAHQAQALQARGTGLPDDPVVGFQVWNLPLNQVEGSLLPGMSARTRAENFAMGPDMIPLMVMASQSFPWPVKKLAERDEARATARQREADGEAVKADVAKAVAYAYAELWATRSTQSLLAEGADVVERMRQLAESRLGSGLGTPADVVGLSAERDALEGALIDARWQEQVARARLAAMVGAADPASVSIMEGQALLARPLPAREALVDAALQNRPELRGARASITAAQARARRARHAAVPDVTASASYMLNMDGLAMARHHGPYRALLGPPDMVTVGVSVPVPLLGPWKQGRAAEAAGIGVRQAEAEVAALERLAQLEVDESLAAVEHATRHVKLHETVLVPRAQEQLRLARDAYAAGGGDAQAVLSAERALRSHHVERVQSELEHARHLADLERITGLPLLDFVNAPPSHAHDAAKRGGEGAP